MAWATPRVRLNGRGLYDGARGNTLVLSPITVTWGSDTGEEQPAAATAQITFLFRDTMAELPDLQKGAEIEIRDMSDPVTPAYVIAGIVQTMSARPSDRVEGALEVTVDMVDYRAPFENEYAQVEWPASDDRRAQLFQIMQDHGWSLNAPSDNRDSSREVLNSIKLMTLLKRYTSRFRGRIYDTSWRELDGVLHKQISVTKGSARAVTPDKLSASDTGWDRQLIPPTVEGNPGPMLTLPASNILNDPEWSSGPEDAVTAVKLSVVTQGDDGLSDLTGHNYRTDAVTVGKLGLRTIDVETDLENPIDWQPTAALYFNDDAPWRMEALTIRDTDLLPPEIVRHLLNRVNRYETLVVIEGISANRPDPGPTVLRSYIAGGEYTWTGEKWDIKLNLERTILKLDGEGDYWTCARVGAASDPLISEARCNTVGDRLSVADFRFIGEP